MPKKKVKKSVRRRAANHHSMMVSGWMCDWALAADPKRRATGIPFLREFLVEKIQEENFRDANERDEDNTEDLDLSTEAQEIFDLLEEDGLEVNKPPIGRPRKAYKHGSCKITELRLAAEDEYEAPDCYGKAVMFADFYRTRTEAVHTLIVLPKYAEALREIHRYQRKHSE